MKSIGILSYLVKTDLGGKRKDTLLVETGIGEKGKDTLLVETGIGEKGKGLLLMETCYAPLDMMLWVKPFVIIFIIYYYTNVTYTKYQ
jgi:hypothetical protein